MRMFSWLIRNVSYFVEHISFLILGIYAHLGVSIQSFLMQYPKKVDGNIALVIVKCDLIQIIFFM